MWDNLLWGRILKNGNSRENTGLRMSSNLDDLETEEVALTHISSFEETSAQHAWYHASESDTPCKTNRIIDIKIQL